MEERILTDNQMDLMATKVRYRIVNAILPAMAAEVTKIFGELVQIEVRNPLRTDVYSSDISFCIEPREDYERITFSLQLFPNSFSDKAFSHLANRALELFTSEVEEMTQNKPLTSEENAGKIVDEIAKYVCNACEMGLGFDGECNGAAYEYYKTCGICQETAQKIYDDIFCKYREVLK